MNTLTHTNCPFCKGSNIRKRFTCKDQFATGEEFDEAKRNLQRFGIRPVDTVELKDPIFFK